MSTPYQPSNGTEGADFEDRWCAHCARDAEFREGYPDIDPAVGCKILADALCFRVTDAEFPKEWIYSESGEPTCTAFTTDPKCPVRCDKTKDMFA